MGGCLWVCILLLARLCCNKNRRLGTCGEVFLTSSLQFTRQCFAHCQVVYA